MWKKKKKQTDSETNDFTTSISDLMAGLLSTLR